MPQSEPATSAPPCAPSTASPSGGAAGPRLERRHRGARHRRCRVRLPGTGWRRQRRQRPARAADAAANVAGDHWHTALGVNICGQWIGPAPAFEKPYDSPNQVANVGIHSHADGLIHTHPFVVGEEGNNATVGKFFSYGGWRPVVRLDSISEARTPPTRVGRPEGRAHGHVVEQRRRLPVRQVQGSEGRAHLGRRRQAADRATRPTTTSRRSNGGDLHRCRRVRRCRSRRRRARRSTRSPTSRRQS